MLDFGFLTKKEIDSLNIQTNIDMESEKQINTLLESKLKLLPEISNEKTVLN